MTTTRVYNTPLPFTLEGSGERASTHLLMIHGFTGSPSEFRRLAYAMQDLGFSVHGVLLPGHGTTPEDMIRTGWLDWSGHVLQAYDTLHKQGAKRIIAMGHSMGGLLALKLAIERTVDAVVSLATPIFLTSNKTALAVLLQYFLKYVERKPTVAAHIIEEACTYDRTPVPCVVDLRKLMKHVKANLHQVRAPLFVGQGELDGLVKSQSADYIYKHVGSSLRQIPYYPVTSHAILLDEEREQVYEDIYRFLTVIENYGAWEQAAAGLAP
jgi:carboxylesterase